MSAKSQLRRNITSSMPPRGVHTGVGSAGVTGFIPAFELYRLNNGSPAVCTACIEICCREHNGNTRMFSVAEV
jgi:hypothetical protein